MFEVTRGGRRCIAIFVCDVCDCEFRLSTKEAMRFDSDGTTVYIGEDAMPHVKPNLRVMAKCPNCSFLLSTKDIEVSDEVESEDSLKPDAEAAEELHKKIMEKYGKIEMPETEKKKEKTKFEKYLRGK